MRASLFFFASIALTALAPRAFAQAPPADPPPAAAPTETPPPPPPPGAPWSAPPPPLPPPPAPAPALVEPTDTWRDEPRLRIGISSAVGPTSGDYPGWMIAPVVLRVGAQIIEEVSIVYQNTAFLMFFDVPGSSADGNLVDQNAILGLVTLADVVDLGGGVALDVFDTRDGPDVAPGLQARVAVNLGPGRNEETGRRIAFNLSADVHATFVEDEAVVVFPFGLGAEFF